MSQLYPLGGGTPAAAEIPADFLSAWGAQSYQAHRELWRDAGGGAGRVLIPDRGL